MPTFNTERPRHRDAASSLVFKKPCLCVFVSLCLMFSVSLLLAPAGAARRAEYASTPEGRLRIFDEVWEQVSERYFDPSFHGVDWGGLRAELRPRAAEARGGAELYALLRRMLGSLRDPHTRVYAPGESTDWRVHRYVS